MNNLKSDLGFLKILEETLQLKHDEIQKNMNKKLVDLGIDSLQISILQNFFHPKPSLLLLYNATIDFIVELWKTNKLSVKKEALNEEQPNLGPFKFLEMQESYFIGRYISERIVPCQAYSEFDFNYLDISVLNKAMDSVIRQHPMLRAHIVDGQFQEIRNLEQFREIFSEIHIERTNIDCETRRIECMNALKNKPNCFWNIEATVFPNGTTRLHILIDMIFLDASSIFIVIRDLVLTYNNLLDQNLNIYIENNDSSFFEYCSLLSSTSESLESREYWLNRIDSMPGPPLIRNRLKISNNETLFKRVYLSLNSKLWRNLKFKAQQIQVTPSSLILAAFSEILRTYSEEPDFTVTITITNRQINGKDFSNVVGDFTNVVLLSIKDDSNFQTKVKRINNDLLEALNHKDMSGLKVMRLIREKKSDSFFLLPIVFTSLLGIDVIPFSHMGETIPNLVYQQLQVMVCLGWLTQGICFLI